MQNKRILLLIASCALISILPVASLVAFILFVYEDFASLAPFIVACHLLFLVLSALALLLIRHFFNRVRGIFRILNMTGVPTWSLTPGKTSLGTIKINKHFSKLLGLADVQETYSEDWYSQRIHPAERDAVLYQPFKAPLPPGQEYSKQCRMLHEDGHWHWVEVKGYATRWGTDGLPSRMAGICLDIQDQMDREKEILEYQYTLEDKILDRTLALQTSETALLREKARLRGVIRSLPEIVCFKDCEHNMLGASLAFLDFFQVTEAEVLNQKITAPAFLRGFSQDVLDEFLRQDEHALQNGILRLEEHLQQTDGTYKWFETLKVPYFDDDGVVLGTMAISRDITSAKKAEETILNSNEEAMAAARAKSAFLANMSHEIRTPLSGIIGMNYLAMQKQDREEVQDYLQKVDKSARHLLNIVNDVLDFSKIEAGKLVLENIPFSLLSSVQSVMETMRLKAEDGGLSFTAILPEEGEEGDIYLGDPLRLEQILLNLTSNAIKFTIKGSVVLEVQKGPVDTSTCPPTQPVAIHVRDTGIGISREQLDGLFQPFSQGDSSTSRKFGGTGLGLAISCSLASSMDGILSAKSELGVGSCFTLKVSLPLAGNLVDNQLPFPREGEIAVTLSELEPLGLRVLVAEDNEINQLIAVEILQNMGCTVDCVENGQEAVGYAKAYTYDVVLMDLQMPVLDGLEATRVLRAEGVKIPIIALTAHAMQDEREACLAAGMQDQVTKPIDISVLYNVLCKVKAG